MVVRQQHANLGRACSAPLQWRVCRVAGVIGHSARLPVASRGCRRRGERHRNLLTRRHAQTYVSLAASLGACVGQRAGRTFATIAPSAARVRAGAVGSSPRWCAGARLRLDLHRAVEQRGALLHASQPQAAVLPVLAQHARRVEAAPVVANRARAACSAVLRQRHPDVVRVGVFGGVGQRLLDRYDIVAVSTSAAGALSGR